MSSSTDEGRGAGSRRGLLRGIGGAGVAAAGLAAAQGTAQAAPTAPAAPATGRAGRGGPVGSWSVLITVEGQHEVERAHFSFHADGQLIMQTISDSGTGIGSWRPTDTGFVFALRHLRKGPDGAFLLEVRIRQEARLTSRGTFVAEGTGRAVDAAGNVLMVVRAKATGTRFGIDD